MRYFLTIALAICFSISHGQKITDFVPAGYSILDSAYGDLNKDGLSDAAIIAQDSTSRILLILFKNPSGYTVAARSNSFILKNDNPSMEDPYQQIKITNGVLRINFQLFYNAGSWDVTNASYKFRYDKNQFILISARKNIFNRATHDEADYSYDFLAKKRILTKGNKKTSKRITIVPLKTLKTFPKPFTWEVEKGVYL